MKRSHVMIGGFLILAVLVLAGTAGAVPPDGPKLSVEEIRGELIAIQDEIEEINERIDEGGDFTGIEARISALEENVTALDAALAVLEGDVSALDSNVSALGSNVNALDANVSALEGGMDTLTGTDYHTDAVGGNQPFSNRPPYLGLNYIICLHGIYPPRSSPSPGAMDDESVIVRGIGDGGAIGEVSLFAGNFAPRNWAFCAGQLLPISGHEALFSILGTTYGGDGQTTFALPDLRGRVPVGAGWGPGLSDIRWGQKGGTDEVRLTTSHLPAHLHGFSLYL
jgi:microcystin-dependent protein